MAQGKDWGWLKGVQEVLRKDVHSQRSGTRRRDTLTLTIRNSWMFKLQVIVSLCPDANRVTICLSSLRIQHMVSGFGTPRDEC